jgi:16S rRNA (guanine(966)-N(2))-methyltransferase RsmD
VRPTTDRVREALFSYLGDFIVDSVVLDLFAGSGALGLESLSRGAVSVVFVERAALTVQVLKQNIASLGYLSESHVIKGNALWALGRIAEKNIQFDCIFLDPPYDSDFLVKSFYGIAQKKLLFQQGRIIAEHPKGFNFDIPDSMQIVRTRNYGSSALTTVEWK